MSALSVEIKKLDGSRVEISGEIPLDVFELERAETIKSFSKTIELDGFRKGHIPESVLIRHIGEEAVLNEMAESALRKAYPDIIEKNNIDAIGKPEVIITKIARGNPLGFKIITSVMPNITLPNYKKIATDIKTEKMVPTTDTEVENVISEIRKARIINKNKESGLSANEVGIKNYESTKPPNTQDSISEKEPMLPELTDDFVKTLGKFESIADFRKKIRDNITKEKEINARDKRRMQIADKLISETSFTLPDIVIDGEALKILGKMKDDIAGMGLEWNEYLKHIKKTEDEIKKEIRPEAHKRGKLELIMEKIAEMEKIEPDQAEVKKQVDIILEQYKNAREENVQLYVESVLKNEAVLTFLEKQG